MRRRIMEYEKDNFPVGSIATFTYTGNYLEINLPKGTYKLQCWGALGGSNGTNSTYSITAHSGGKGGYSEGILTLPQRTTLRAYVGGAGSASSGGYNGGGSTTGSSSYSTGTSGTAGYELGVSRMGGGGATDIRLSDGSLYSRMIVAGGGSGGAACYLKKTVASTTWNSSLTFTNSYQWVYNSSDGNTYYITEVILGGWSPGDYIRFKMTFPKYTQMIWHVNGTDTGHTKLTSGSYTYKTVPSGCTAITLLTFNDAGVTEYVSHSSLTNRDGGKLVASTSTSTSSDYQTGYAGGGTSGLGSSPGTLSSGGGSFGQGKAQSVSNYRYCSGGGGGGWYGGSSGYSDSSMSSVRSMGGGSGFVNIAANASYRPSGYTGLLLDSGETKAGNTSFPNTTGTGNETGHTGNGYIKITRIASYTVTFRFLDGEGEPLTSTSFTVTNSEHTYNLTTDSNGEAIGIVINGTYTVSCQGYSIDVTSISVTGNQTFIFNAIELLDFTYTGGIQTKTLKAGTYKLECWGAQGGNATYGSYTGTGGKGGYSVGTLVVDTDTQLYIMVGGQGTFNSGSSAATPGGYNGGGTGYNYSTTYTAAGGGGASDIRIGRNSVYARVIVAGGGGGSGVYSSTAGTGGHGGGTSGGTGSTVYSGYGVGTGGTQTSAGTCNGSGNYTGSASFGSGASKTSGSGGYNGAGGGGGWYGGGCGGAVSNCGGGGSGYVYNASTASNYPSGCLLNSSYYLSNAQTIAGNASMPSPSGSTETGHSGNGFVRITKI